MSLISDVHYDFFFILTSSIYSTQHVLIITVIMRADNYVHLHETITSLNRYCTCICGFYEENSCTAVIWIHMLIYSYFFSLLCLSFKLISQSTKLIFSLSYIVLAMYIFVVIHPYLKFPLPWMFSLLFVGTGTSACQQDSGHWFKT